MPLKICILIEKLNEGGAERSAGLLSKILSKLGHKVFIISIFDEIVYPFQGELINIGALENTSGSIKNKLNRYWQIHKQIKKYQFDLILDFRIKDVFLREVFLNLFMFKKERMVNMIRSYNLSWYLPKPKPLSKFLYKNYLSLNTVSQEVKALVEKTYGFSNVNSIYSPIDLDEIKAKSRDEISIKDEYIIAIGRLEPIKQFDKLIEAYSRTILPSHNVKLYILGNGSQIEILKDTIRNFKLEGDVLLIPFKDNPFSYLKQARLLVLCSKNEGFPRVIIESLACETPVLSFNCKSGPSEILKHRKNGLLVKDQDFDGLSNAINEFITNKELYAFCKKNALESVEQFSIDTIQHEWKKYLKYLGLVESLKN